MNEGSVTSALNDLRTMILTPMPPTIVSTSGISDSTVSSSNEASLCQSSGNSSDTAAQEPSEDCRTSSSSSNQPRDENDVDLPSRFTRVIGKGTFFIISLYLKYLFSYLLFKIIFCIFIILMTSVLKIFSIYMK